ncbi:MAG: glycosyltransferase family 4 protein [Acidobacteriota bacterium]|nr:MAG: glycosyltransferase family 4 protein [Acidobacteriota bacterium]
MEVTTQSQKHGNHDRADGSMHLIYVTAALPFSSGETFFVPEIEELQRCGVRVTVVPIRPGPSVIHADAGRLIGITIAVPLISLSIIRNAVAEIVRAPALAFRAAKLITKSRNVHIFLKNLIVFPKGLWMAQVARLQGADHIHAHWASTSATAALIASVVSGIPWSFTAHRWDIPENNLLDIKAQSARFVRAIDLQGKRELETLIERRRDKLRVIHIGVTAGRTVPENSAEQRRGLRVLIGARFVEVKGHRYAVEAMAKLKAAGVDVSLDLAGDGPLKKNIEKYAGQLAVPDRIHFQGNVDHQELLAQLRDHQWDVALLPSIVTKESKEGIPVFLIEAMAAGVPVVATDTGGIPELLDNGAGILIPQRDAEAIAITLARLANDCNLRLQLQEKCLRRVHDQFTIESSVSALQQAIRNGAGNPETLDGILGAQLR